MRRRLTPVAMLLGLALAASAADSNAAPPAATFVGALFFTKYGPCVDAGGGKSANVFRSSFTYTVGSRFALGKVEGITCTNDDVDGVIFAPDGDLFVGAKANGVHKVNVRTGTFSTIKLAVPAFHLMLDPKGTELWVSGIPGQPARVPVAPGRNAEVQTLTGEDTRITTIAWDQAGHAYYTASEYTGNGHFGRIDLAKRTTKRLLSNVPAAHGMAFDAYTGDFILMGASHVTQISIRGEPTIVSDLDVNMANLDQGAVDGRGHLYAACNCGKMVFVDYSVGRKVNAPQNFTAVVPLVTDLDDIAPLIGVSEIVEEQGRLRIMVPAAILFDFDRHALKPAAEAALAEIKASIIDQYPNGRLIVEGHTDDRGTSEYNMKLSTDRAQSVADWLRRHGISDDLLQMKGYGKTRPRYPNTTDADRALNRRVEIIVVK